MWSQATKTIVLSVLISAFGFYMGANTVQPEKIYVQTVKVVKPQDAEQICFERAEWAKQAMIEKYGTNEDRADELAPMIAYASFIEGVPVEYLVSVYQTESNFKPEQKSKKGAIGVSQITPKAWKNEIPYNVHNEQGNILAGAYVLKRYFLETGSWEKAIKAYNIGITDFNNGKNMPAAERYKRKVFDNLNLIVAQNDHKPRG